ncbi:hypothetical protein P3T23_009671, partial [Paraburkholderia sp. GAS448]
RPSTHGATKRKLLRRKTCRNCYEIISVKESSVFAVNKNASFESRMGGPPGQVRA